MEKSARGGRNYGNLVVLFVALVLQQLDPVNATNVSATAPSDDNNNGNAFIIWIIVGGVLAGILSIVIPFIKLAIFCKKIQNQNSRPRTVAVTSHIYNSRFSLRPQQPGLPYSVFDNAVAGLPAEGAVGK